MKSSVLFASFALFGSLVCGVPLETPNSASTNEIPTEILSGLERCTAEGGVTGILNCAGSRVLKSMEKLDGQSVLEILPGVTLTSDNPASTRTAKDLKTVDLPKDPDTKATKLLDLLLDSASRFISSRTLKINLPKTTPENLARALEEGRGKMKKMMGPLMLGLGAKMITIVPIMLGGLALLAAKALLIGKLAFVISIILFVQYFFSGKNIIPYGPYGGGLGTLNTNYGAYGTYGTNSLGGWGTSAQYPYARALNAVDEAEENSKTAQELAYSSHNNK